MRQILEANTQREIPVYTVIIMSASYLGHCTRFEGLPEAINDGECLLPRMGQLRTAIEEPVGARIDPELTTALLEDIGDSEDQLPILQHAMMRTWEHWRTQGQPEEPVGLRHYQATGTATEALSRHAQEVYDQLDGDEARRITKVVFKRLSTGVSGTPTTLAEVVSVSGCPTVSCRLCRRDAAGPWDGFPGSGATIDAGS